MKPPWVDVALRGADSAFFTVEVGGRTYIEQWAAYDGVTEAGHHRLRFVVRADPSAIGMGGRARLSRAHLLCDGDLRPASYVVEGAGGRTRFDFDGTAVAVAFPEGTRQRLEHVDFDYLVDGDVPATMALAYAAIACRRPGTRFEDVDVSLFSVQTVASVPYRTMPAEPPPAPGRWHRTSHDGEVLLDDAGAMLECRLPKLGIVVFRASAGAPWPDWEAEAARLPPPPGYRVPEGARFRVEDLEVDGPVTAIGAALSVPEGPGPFPSVLFIGGSGVHDRHGIAGEIDIGSHELMDALAEAGFLGLRFDARGGGTTRLGDDALDRGLRSDIDDARACLAHLLRDPRTAGRPSFLIGHSQGGSVALALAGEARPPGAVSDQLESLPRFQPDGTALDSKLERIRRRRKHSGPSGVVLMAAMGRDLDEVLDDQTVEQGRALSLDDAQVAALREDGREVAALVRSGVDWTEEAVPHRFLAALRTRTWYADLLRYAPKELMGSVACPLLICQGGKDIQISPSRDAAALVAAAEAARLDLEYCYFPDLDHLFKRCEGRSSIDQYCQDRRVDRAFIARVAAWLRSRVALA